MSWPIVYDHGSPLSFGGTVPHPRSFADSRIVVLPVPVDRTTSYVPGTRNGPREILQASSHMELWDEELGVDIHELGIFTLPEMELPFGELAPLMAEIHRVASEILAHDKFLVTLGGEHSITPPLVAAAREAGDAHMGFGEYAAAVELYQAALQKGGEDANLVNTRLGAALALAGRRAEAEAAFRAVTGNRADLAGFWLAWLARRPA